MSLNSKVNFEIAKLLKEKGFEEQCSYFYAKSNSKLFGIDEHNRCYPIKNKPKTLYVTAHVVPLNYKNIYNAPTIAQVVDWLLDKHNVYLYCEIGENPRNFYPVIVIDTVKTTFKYSYEHWEEGLKGAYEKGIEYIIQNKLI